MGFLNCFTHFKINPLKFLFLAFACFLTAQFSSPLLTNSLSFSFSFSLPIRFCTGIALAGILICGYRYSLSVFLGSLTSHLILVSNGVGDIVDVKHPILVSFLIAMSSSLQAVISVFFIKRVVKSPHSNLLDQEKDIGLLLLIGGSVGGAMTATFEALILLLEKVLILQEGYFFHWFTWWVGNMIGVILILPLILLLVNHKISPVRKAITFIPVLMLSVLVFVLFLYGRNSEQSSLKHEFSKLALRRAHAITESIQTYKRILSSIQHFYAASRFVDRNEFLAFTKDLYLEYKGIQFLGWVPRVSYNEMKKYENLVHKDGYSDFRFMEMKAKDKVPVKKRKEYFPVYYVEPYEKNKNYLGFDFSFDSSSVETLYEARDSGKQVATQLVVLPLGEKEKKQSHFLVFHPIYELKKPSQTVSERRKALKGFIVGLFNVHHLMESALSDFKDGIMNLHVSHDLASGGEKASIFGHKVSNALFSHESQLKVGGLKWILEFTPTLGFLGKKYNWKSWFVAILGFFFVSLLQIFLLIITARTEVIKRLVHEQTIEIRQANEGLERAIEKLTHSNTELERFAYIASHDLQEPLRMVINFTQLLKTEYAQKLDETALEYIHFATHSAKRMQELIEDLLDYSRVGQDAEQMRDVDCNSSLQLAIENLSESIKQRGAKITCDHLPTVLGSPIRMVRLMQNLVGNSIKYSSSNKVPLIHVGVKEQEMQWLFSVKDNGIGIKKEYLDKVFLPFKRLHLQSEYRGTGIGLAICKKIVESLNGRIWIQSKVGQGSTFYFTVSKHLKNNEDSDYAQAG